MKKIIGLTKVRNESDIIESFCRYNLTYCDSMLVYDTGSLDNTREIIQSMIDEGLAIHFADDIKSLSLPLLDIFNAMAIKAIDEYGADLIVRLDADEFLYHTDAVNPRAELENLNEKVEYQAPWRTYTYMPDSGGRKDFLPNSFTHYRNPLLETFNKTIASKYLLKDKQAKYAPGGHSMIYPEKFHNDIAVEKPEKLVFAHFPLRSKAQLMTKSIPGWIDTLKLPKATRKGMALQWELLFNEFRDRGDISEEKIKHHSIVYGLHENTMKSILTEIGDRLTVQEPMDVSFCADKVRLRYTDYKADQQILIRTALTSFESALYAAEEREAQLSRKQGIIERFCRKLGI